MTGFQTSGANCFRGRLCAVVAIGAALAAAPAYAQRTEENVNTQSDDAFGRAVGNERSGLYSGFDVRGFNPSEAGNVRLQGLYFDLQELISARLIQGNTIRVGLASVANTVLIPLQDILGTGSDTRMNTPGKSSGNWAFRFSWDQLTPEMTKRLRTMVDIYDR